ncbi:hypothetical protein [Shimia sp. FJ5]|uniref:DUF7424 family protein n=1 Tax=Shimia sp. FJ5 TaxID=3079054 RepID=UPI00261DC01D|nr:hypothetical protein [Shimia sp. FJ5]MDV4143538.1 hypothetical protein [Shimia sp. FJ5]
MKRAILAGAVALTLSGCKTFVEADIYTSDVLAVAEGETLSVDMNLGLEMPGMDTCNEHAEAITAAYASSFQAAEFRTCENIGLDTILQMRVTTSLYDLKTTEAQASEPVSVAVFVQETGTLTVLFIPNDAASRQLWDALPNNLTSMATYDPKPFLTANVINDGRTAMEFQAEGAFVNDTPITFATVSSMDRRGELEVRLSDVANAAFAADRAVMIGGLVVTSNE